jgi:hypothetical protein
MYPGITEAQIMQVAGAIQTLVKSTSSQIHPPAIEAA